MPLYTADALILRTYKLGEADRIVVFLTRDRGKRRGVARGARRTRSRFSGGLEPLTLARVEYFEREHRDLVRLSYVEPVVSPLSRAGSDGLGYASYFAELIDAWAPEADPNERLYRLGASVAEAFIGGTAAEPLARYVEYWVLRLQGVYPSILTCQRCGARLERDALLARPAGVLVCRACGARDADLDVSGETLAFLRTAARVSPVRVGALPFLPTVARELATLHRVLMAVHLEHEPRSTRVLRDIGLEVHERGGEPAPAAQPPARRRKTG